MQLCTTLKCQSAAQRHLAATNATAYCQRHLAIEKKKSQPKTTDWSEGQPSSGRWSQQNQSKPPNCWEYEWKCISVDQRFCHDFNFFKTTTKKKQTQRKNPNICLGFFKIWRDHCWWARRTASWTHPGGWKPPGGNRYRSRKADRKDKEHSHCYCIRRRGEPERMSRRRSRRRRNMRWRRVGCKHKEGVAVERWRMEWPVGWGRCKRRCWHKMAGCKWCSRKTAGNDPASKATAKCGSECGRPRRWFRVSRRRAAEGSLLPAPLICITPHRSAATRTAPIQLIDYHSHFQGWPVGIECHLATFSQIHRPQYRLNIVFSHHILNRLDGSEWFEASIALDWPS